MRGNFFTEGSPFSAEIFFILLAFFVVIVDLNNKVQAPGAINAVIWAIRSTKCQTSWVGQAGANRVKQGPSSQTGLSRGQAGKIAKTGHKRPWLYSWSKIWDFFPD